MLYLSRAQHRLLYNMTRLRLLVMSWICLSLGVGVFLWGLPARSSAAGGISPASGTDRALAYKHVTTLTNTQTAPTPTPFSNPTATPPFQSGHGHDLFQVICMPCHGDLGQGLTDEFRLREYPPEDTNCWASGCHGARPYDNGFTLPKTIPALIGANTLKRFADAQLLYDYIHKSMPFNAPGSLTADQYLQLTAFLLEENSLLTKNSQLDVAALRHIPVRPAATPVPPSQASAANSPWLLIGAMIVGALILAAYVIKHSRSSSASR